MTETQRKSRRAWKIKNRDRLLEYDRQWKRKNPEKVKLGIARATRRRQEKLYGIPSLEVERLLREQNGLCKVCGEKLISPCVDHCHETKKVRGLLCSNCNLGLGCFKDRPEILQSAVKYLLET